MTFKEFRDSVYYRKPGNFVVTDSRGEASVLQWEASNQKWYKMEPYWGRKEFGYLDQFERSKILHIRPL